MLFAALLALSAFSFSCTKNSLDCCTAPYQPFINAEKNGAKWDAAVSTSKDGDSTTIVGAQTEERLLMRIKFTGKGVYNLRGNQAIFLLLWGRM